MTVYVDNMRVYAIADRGSGRPVAGRWSHLMADSPDELAGFAARLGLRPEWVQFPGTAREHYDVVEAVRRRAVAAGAVPISYPDDTGNVIATKRLQASALDAAGRGWHVFPLRPGTKVPAVRHWDHEATTGTEQIEELWTAQLRRRDGWSVPEPPNVGIACGPSNLVVLDLDLAKPGQDSTRCPVQWRDHDISSGTEVLAVLAGQAGQGVPDTYEVVTPSGGRHLYFAAPEDVSVRNSTGHLGPMIDIRGKGGYVVAAGSRLHPRPDRDNASAGPGKPAYRLVKDIQTARLPDWLTDAAAADRQRDDHAAAGRSPRGTRDQSLSSPSDSYGAAALRGESDRVQSAPVGQRNHTLNSAAYSLGQLIAAGALDQARAVEALTDAATAAGLEEPEIAATIESGLSAGLKRPRALPERRSAPVGTGTSVGSERRDEAADGVDQAQNPGRPAGVPLEQSDRLEHQPDQGSPNVGVELVSAEQPRTTEQGDTRAATTNAPRSMADASGPSEGKADPRYTISEVDAAYAGWLFTEAWDSFWTGRPPCYPADTLRIACEWEGLSTLGKSDRRFGPRPRATFIDAPGEELVDREVWHSWSQSQRDEWYFTRHERARAAATNVRGHHETVDSLTVRGSTRGSQGTGAETSGASHRPAEPGTNQPVDTEEFVQALLAVLQSRGVIDRAAWDAIFAAAAQRSATAESRDDAGLATTRKSDPPASATKASAEELDTREMASAGHPDATSRADAAVIRAEVDRADSETTNDIDGGLRAEDLTDAPSAALAARQGPPPGKPRQPDSLTAETAPAEPSDNTPNPHMILDEAIGQARAAVADLEATRADSRHQSRKEASDAAVQNDRTAYWAEPEVDL